MTERSVSDETSPEAGNPKLREIGRLLKEEESRFIGYAEIERKSKELGFGMTVRTLRFYVDEGILPPPKKVGKAPVYEEEWILNVLLSIHLMKTRLNRSLAEIRLILQRLQDGEASVLGDKLSILYEEYVKSGSLKPVERDWLVEAFFALLTGKHGRTLGPSEVRLTELVRAVEELGRWRTATSGAEEWVPPEPRALLLFLNIPEGAPVAEEPRPAAPAPDSEAKAPPPPVESKPAEPKAPEARIDKAEAPKPPANLPTPIPIPPGAIAVERARTLEEQFIQRFEAAFERLEQLEDPRDGKVLRVTPRDRSHLKRDHSARVIELMKRNRVYERSLLDVIPLDEASEYHVHQRSFLGKGELRVVVAALSLSPLEAFVTRRHAREPLGPADIEKAVAELVVQDDIFYYVGILSTVGWSGEARAHPRAGRNLLVSLIEPGTPEPGLRAPPWRATFATDPRWKSLERLFDPETFAEKVDRARRQLLEIDDLKLRGGHVILKNIREDIDVPPEALRAAVNELLKSDPELSTQEVSGREILKRKRI